MLGAAGRLLQGDKTVRRDVGQVLFTTSSIFKQEKDHVFFALGTTSSKEQIMTHDNQTLMSAVESLHYKQKNNPDCFSTCDLKDLDTLTRGINRLLGEAYRGLLTEGRHGQQIRNTHALYEKLEKKWRNYEYAVKKAAEAKYSPDQPRVPVGNPDGGEWTGTGGGSRDGGDSSGGGSSGSGSSPSAGKLPSVSPAAGNGSSSNNPKPLDTNKAAQHAAANVYDPKKFPHGRGKCATKVREAVEAGLGHPIPTEDLPPLRKVPNPRTGVDEETRWAKDYGDTFKKVGLSDKITIEAGVGDHTPLYQPKIGDVAVIQPTSDPGHPEGHTAIYTREGWVSDYKQGGTLYPNSRYRSEKPSYTVYRKPD